jgi:hypothetical protein
MDTPLTTLRRHPFEMLDHICNINFRAIDSHFDQNLIEQPSRGADERVTLPVFLISGLLANKHNQRLRRPFPENRLRRVFPKITASTSCRRFLKGHDAQPWREIRSSRCACSSLGDTLTLGVRPARRLGLSGDVRPGLPVRLVAGRGKSVGSERTRKIRDTSVPRHGFPALSLRKFVLRKPATRWCGGSILLSRGRDTVWEANFCWYIRGRPRDSADRFPSDSTGV